MAGKLKSHEQRRILLFGEALRENSRTILLSIPVFVFGFLFYSVLGDREGIAGSLGHMGISFKNIHRHYWQKDFLLKIAYFLFYKASGYAPPSEGKASTILHAAQAAASLKDYTLAEEKYREALMEAEKIDRIDQAGYIWGHLGILELNRGNTDKAGEYIQKSYKILEAAAKKNPRSFYLQVWLSFAELAMAEQFLATGSNKRAFEWAKKAQTRAEKHDLKIRKMDVAKLLARITHASNEESGGIDEDLVL